MRKNKLVATAFALILAATILAITPLSYAQVPTRNDAAYLSVNPALIGLNQPLTVNLWIYPAPSTRFYNWLQEGFKNISITFTRPDGTKDTFMPTDGSGGLGPGETEMIGAIWFLYYPNQVGTWTAQFTMPSQTLGTGMEAIIYPTATSKVVSFTVQKDLVQIGLPPVALPTGYWQRPINSDNREWYQISGNWLQSAYDDGGTVFNPYSKAPNAPHILWKRETNMEGLVGGIWGSLSFEDNSPARNPIILQGKVYYNMPGTVFQCVDLRTGELIYEKPGAPTIGQVLRAATRDPVRGTQETEGAQIAPSLWELGSSQWKRYNFLTGALMQTITNVPTPTAHWVGTAGAFTASWFEGDPVVYVIRQGGFNTTIPYRLKENELIKWDYTKVTGNNWMTGIVWNVSLKNPDGTGPGEGQRGSGFHKSADGTVGVVGTTGQNDLYAFNLATGARLWNKTVGFEMMGGVGNYAEGTINVWDSVTMKIHNIDIKTGTELWVSDVVGNYPWGSQQSARGSAYGNLYFCTYDGYVNSLSLAKGKVNWRFFCGNTTETPFGNWAPYAGPAIADGKIYVSTSEHSPTQPRLRGNKLFCIDAYTGKGIWNISGVIGSAYGGQRALADGYYVGVNENDGLMYCIGKGKTATTVTAPQTTIAKGTSFLIQGAVMDQSPAQRNTPAISDANMNVWMEYLHMQKPMPTNVKGVPVLLTATAPDGSNLDIATVTSDGYGRFFYAWTPPNVGTYKIQATFAGSESYWSSSEETAVNVGAAAAASVAPSAASTPPSATVTAPSTPPPLASPPASPTQPASPSPTVAPPPAVAAPSMTLYIAMAAVASAVVAIAAVVLVLRRRAK